MERILHSYPSIYNLGHKAIATILDGNVFVEEKVDGSQFSFGNIDGELCCRSKGKQIIIDAPEKLFSKAVDTARLVFPMLKPGWVYRAEYVSKPKHNTIAYGRVPKDFLVIFDICPALETYLGPEEKRVEADRIGLESVPFFFAGKISSIDMFKDLLRTDSFLGNTKVEGIVIKRYDMFLADKKVAMAKYVSEEFKEKHGAAWKLSNPTKLDIIQSLILELKTEARWTKAIQHLKEAGELEDSPRDIGKLIKEIPVDILKEEEEHIKDILFKYAWKQIQRAVVSGFPEFYKEHLAKKAFEGKDENTTQ